MIVVKIELWRASKGARAEAEAEEVGRLYIANTGGTAKRGDYQVAVCRRGSTDPPADLYPEGSRSGAPEATRSGFVLNYPRLSYNVWRLVLRALRSCFPEERG